MNTNPNHNNNSAMKTNHTNQEIIYLQKNSVDIVVKKREADNTGFTNIDNLDWNSL